MAAQITSYNKLEDLGRTRLSPNFFMREFLYSEIAVWHGMRNIPDDPERAIWAGRQLCTQLLEPLQATFGRVHVRSGYRSPEVNGFGNAHRLNCASNEKNHGKHIWDHPDANGHYGATACIVLPWLLDHVERGGSWTDMAWWIHDHLPYSSLYFFPKLLAFNINWHERPVRKVDSYAAPKGCLIQAGSAGEPGMHAEHYAGFPPMQGGRITSPAAVRTVDTPSRSREATHAQEQRTRRPSGKRARGGSSTPERVVSAQPSLPESTGGKVFYRAVHTRNKWRKAGGHKSLESAIHGRNGAAALFRGKVRINYATHGTPLYALVWQEGASTGYVMRPDLQKTGEMEMITVSVRQLHDLEDRGGASERELAALFPSS